jgi:hypothetical protein
LAIAAGFDRESASDQYIAGEKAIFQDVVFLDAVQLVLKG